MSENETQTTTADTTVMNVVHAAPADQTPPADDQAPATDQLDPPTDTPPAVDADTTEPEPEPQPEPDPVDPATLPEYIRDGIAHGYVGDKPTA